MSIWSQCKPISRPSNWHCFSLIRYCENGLLLEIVLDQGKLFTSKFWRLLHQLIGIDLKMLTAYHLQMDSTSKWTNKTIDQCIYFYVERHQCGWAKVLP